MVSSATAARQLNAPSLDAAPAARRPFRELLEATRPFTKESRLRSWWELGSTFAALGACLAIAALPVFWGFRLVASVIGGLVVVRAFILYHDHVHGAFLRGSRLARGLLYTFGVLVVAPVKVWRETHNYHHNHTAKLVGSSIGSFATMTTQQWAQCTPRQRMHYRMVRHPLTVLFGYITLFLLDMGVMSFLRSPRKRWDSLLALVVNAAVTYALVSRFGAAVWFFCHFLPLFVACATGGYLFYAQHNFEGLVIQPRETWSYDRAALESSSYMETGPILRWFTGSIGFHHVHHLNPTIPFYRLEEAMKAIPELQNPGKTRLTPAQVRACFALKLWDPASGRMVGYPAAD